MKVLSSLALAIVVLYWLHLLRNFSILYFITLGSFIVAIFLVRLQQPIITSKANIQLFVIFTLWIYASTIAIAQQSQINESPLIGLFRLWSVFPLIYASAVLAMQPIQERMRLFVVFYLIAALTFPLQYTIGPIDWFAESSERAGAERFASLTGSLTSFGISLGVAGVAALCFLPRSVAVGAFVLLTLGGLLSLQKAAVANIVLALLLSAWVRRQDLLSTLKAATYSTITIVVTAMILFYAAASNDVISDMLEIILRSTSGLIFADANLTADVSFFQSIYDRITELPSLAISHYDTASLLLGAGVFGAAGSLGYPEIPMAHNGIVEILLVFGIPLGVAINIYLVAFIARLVSKAHRSKDKELRFLAVCAILFYTNNVFSGGGFFQPISAFIFWSIYFRTCALNELSHQQRIRKITSHTLEAS